MIEGLQDLYGFCQVLSVTSFHVVMVFLFFLLLRIRPMYTEAFTAAMLAMETTIMGASRLGFEAVRPKFMTMLWVLLL